MAEIQRDGDGAVWLEAWGGVELACKKQADEGMVWGVTLWGTGSPTSWGGKAVGDRRGK